MRILYLSASYIPSQRASSVQVMKMCHALAAAGHEVTLLAKDAPPTAHGLDDYAFYGVAENFRLHKLARPAGRGGGVRYAGAVGRHLWAMRGRYDLVYSRDVWGAWMAAWLGRPVIFEAHGVPPPGFWRDQQARLLRHPNLCRVVAISQALSDELLRTGILPDAKRVVIAHDGADAIPFALTPRSPLARPQIGYVGNLYEGRGVELVARLAATWPGGDFHIVGGNAKDVNAWAARTTPDNLHFHGFSPPAQLSAAYDRFDVLLMPYQRQVRTATARSDTSRWMSPLKMFEYMATGRPIVASALPVLQEVLTHGYNALLAAPDSLAQWYAALNELIMQPALAQRLGHQARQDLLEHYTWPVRAAKVLDGWQT